jgi:hypothetical protein
LIASQIWLTVDFDTVDSGPRASARLASTSRTDRPRTNPAITSASRALVIVTPTPRSREAKASSLQGHLPRGRLDGQVAVAVAGTLALAFTAGGAVPAQELRDLGLQRGLEHQPHRGSGHLFEMLQQAAPLGAGDQLVDLRADALTGRYSCSHGCRSSFVSW